MKIQGRILISFILCELNKYCSDNTPLDEVESKDLLDNLTNEKALVLHSKQVKLSEKYSKMSLNYMRN